MMVATRERQFTLTAIVIALILVAACLAFVMVANYGLDFVFPVPR